MGVYAYRNRLILLVTVSYCLLEQMCVMHQGLCPVVSPRIFVWFYVPSRLAFCPAVRWCGGPVVPLPGGLMIFSYARLCPVMPEICPDMPGYARICPDIPGYARCCLAAGTVRRLLYGLRAAQRSASGAPLADLEIATVDGTGQLRKMPRFTGRASGVTCTRLLGRRADTFSVFVSIKLPGVVSCQPFCIHVTMTDAVNQPTAVYTTGGFQSI